MNETDKSYLEIKITFHHIVILLIGVILIGSFLFYLGYQAGESAIKNQDKNTSSAKGEGKAEEIKIVDKKDPDKIEEVTETPINEEIKLHQQPTKRATAKNKPEKKRIERAEKKPEVKEAKPIKREAYYTIQVAAFPTHDQAKGYSRKFSRAGYPAAISQAVVRGKTWYRVRVGHYDSRAEAIKEKRKLEKLENGQFRVVRTE